MRSHYLQRARIASGCILFAFVLTHYLNHILGNVSIEALEIGRRVFLLVWRNPVGTVLLYGALVVHVLTVFYALAMRRSLKMPRGEAVQIVLGLTIPLLLATHVIANRGAHEIYGLNDTYTYVLLSIWVNDWSQGLLQAIAVVTVWVHGCLGLHYWLRLKAWYPPLQSSLYVLALLIPAAALSGFAGAGKEVALRLQDPAWSQRAFAAINLPATPEAQREAIDWVYSNADRARIASVVTVILVLSFGYGRQRWLRRGQRVVVSYPSGRTVSIERGTSVLEASRSGGIPHASVCGGRGRCSTCRVRISESRSPLPEASEEETKVLRRVGAPDGVRLACQLRPETDLAVVPLLPANASPQDGRARPGYLQGAEREIAILFADLRSFTQFSETKLPFDVVFALNQYFRAMGSAVEAAGGQLDKFIGDGVMALFGIRTDNKQGAREALTAARDMALALDQLNVQLASDLKQPLKMGIGIHGGPAIVGEMGYRHATSVTAIGDAVNTASRLETMTKEFGAQLVVSKHLTDLAGIDMSEHERREITVRGREEPLTIFVVYDARKLDVTVKEERDAPA